MPESFVIIPSHNGREHLPGCLESLLAQTCRDFEALVVDNGSSDGSAAWVRERFPGVRVLELEGNQGFARAVNQGLRLASGDYVALLNNDVELDPRWLERMVAALKGDPHLGAAACKMLDFSSRGILDAAGDVLTRSGLASARGHGQPDRGQFDRPELVFGPCAGAAVYRRAVFDRVGRFDESFFAFYEDIDLDFRMQMQGFQTLYVPTAVCYHKRGATRKTMEREAVKLHVRNDLHCMVKNLPVKLFLKRWPWLIGGRIQHWAGQCGRGFTGPVLRGIAEAILGLPEMVAKRKAIQAASRVQAEHLESLMR